MKNFTRLVRFALPYKLRFGLSIVCAAMVALFYFTELGAVYPLLHILFDSQNPQRWIAEKIDVAANDLAILEARQEEARYVMDEARTGQRDFEALKERVRVLFNDRRSRERALAEHEGEMGPGTWKWGADAPSAEHAERLETLRRAQQLAYARWKELADCGSLYHNNDIVALEHRVAGLHKDLENQRQWLGRYRLAQPYINRYLPADSFKSLLLLIGMVMAGVALKGVFMFLQEILVADVMQLTLFRIRNQFFRRTVNLDMASFSEQGSSELMARFTNDMDSFGQGLNTLMSKLIREPLRIVSCLAGAFLINWRLTLLTLVLVPISAATTYRVGKIMKRAVRRSLESMSTIYKILQESFQGIKIVKAFAMERVERRRFFDETKNLYRKSIRVAMIDAMSDPVLEMLTLATVAIALLAGSYLVLNRTIYLDLGFFQLQLASQAMVMQDLFTLYAMLAGASDPIRKLANVHSKIQRASAAADRICGMMDRAPKVVDRSNAPGLARHRRTIEFDQVVFGYKSASPVLNGVSLKVEHGETIALVGPNGCGKTTLMNLLPRFWDVGHGAIRVDGRDVRDVRLRSLRRQIGIVLQETVLFQDTIANNIAYGDPGASRESIVEAARRAYADGFISAMPNGYDTMVGERGHGLSGGQRQRIALARAMLRDPAILVLDEATSAVDIQDEALIRKAINEFAKGRTTFIISHNLASIQAADRIVLLNAGRVEAVGDDQELQRSSALYQRLHEIHYSREAFPTGAPAVAPSTAPGTAAQGPHSGNLVSEGPSGARPLRAERGHGAAPNGAGLNRKPAPLEREIGPNTTGPR